MPGKKVAMRWRSNFGGDENSAQAIENKGWWRLCAIATLLGGDVLKTPSNIKAVAMVAMSTPKGGGVDRHPPGCRG